MKHHNTFSCSLNYHESGEVVKPFAKKTNHVDMQSNKRLSAFSIAKKVAVHGINEQQFSFFASRYYGPRPQPNFSSTAFVATVAE